MDVPRHFEEITVSIDQGGPVASLVKVPRTMIGAVVVGGVGYVEVAHELLEIGEGGCDEQVKVVLHQYIGQNRDLIHIGGPLQQSQKGRAVLIVREYLLPGIAPAHNMVVGILKLDAERPCHDCDCTVSRTLMSMVKI